jgi:tetratricopeptide (TPR) repeat protein
LPEFVNTDGNGIEEIQVPAVNQYKLIDEAMQLEEKKQPDQALEIWKNAVALDPGNEKAQNGLAVSLYLHGDVEGSFQHLREALRINPLSVQDHFVFGKFILDQGHADQALPELEAAVAIRPHFASGEEALGRAYEMLSKDSEALAHWRKAQLIDPTSVSAMIGTAWLLATSPDASLRNGAEAARLAENAANAQPDNAEVLDTLAASYAEEGLFSRASSTEKQALELAIAQTNKPLSAAIRAHQASFAKQKAFHGDRPLSSQTKPDHRGRPPFDP